MNVNKTQITDENQNLRSGIVKKFFEKDEKKIDDKVFTSREFGFISPDDGSGDVFFESPEAVVADGTVVRFKDLPSKAGTKERKAEIVEVIELGKKGEIKKYIGDIFKKVSSVQDGKEYDHLSMDMDVLRRFIGEYGENTFPGLNKQKLKSIQKKLDLSRAKEVLSHYEIITEETIRRAPAAGMWTLERTIRDYGEDALPGLTTNKLKEIQKEVDLRAMEAVFQETKDVLIGSNYFDVKVNLGYLEDFLVKYGEDTLAGLTRDIIRSMKAKNKELLGIPQIGVIKKFFEEKMYGFIQQEVGRDIKFNLSKLDRIGLDVLEGNEVEFVIGADEKVRIARVIKDNK